jgi:hypothetical protein
VVVGVGGPGDLPTLESLAEALATATRLVQHGGKIVVLSRTEGEFGPAFQRMIGADDPRNAAAALKGHQADDDYLSARALARALAWADIYLVSRLDPQLVEDLSLIVLERPEQARRLVAQSGSCSFVSRAELSRAEVEGEET